MVNSSFETRLEKLNKLLKTEKVGSVYINKESFYLRAYLPSKVNPDWTKLK